MMPLNGQKILILRGEAGALQKKLEAAGAEVFHAPVFNLVDPPSWSDFDEAARAQDQFDYLVFTSAEAVKKTFARLELLQLQLSNRIKIASVGNQTAKVIGDFGFTCHILPEQFQAEGLIAAFEKIDLQGKKIWFPRALVARDELVTSFYSKGASVKLCPVYQNKIATESKETLKKIISQIPLNWVCFTSSSSVQNFFALLRGNKIRLPLVASIGSVTTEELLKFETIATITANPQNIKGLVDAIIHYES